MNNANVLVVEDEAIIAQDLKRRLENQGYGVSAAVATGKDAIQMAGEHMPDLILMDIVLIGDMDGIDAAGEIRARFDIPVIYITAYSDEEILERAKLTEPFGYIIKPFEDRELRSAIEMALYKHNMEKKMREKSEFLKNILESLSHPFYVIDANDYTVKLANSAARLGALTEGSKCYQLTHKTDSPCAGEEHPCTIKEIKRTKQPVLLEHTHYDEDGNARYFEIHGYPIENKDGEIDRIIEYAIDVSETKKLEQQFQQAQKMESIGRLASGVAHDFNNLLTAILGYSELCLMSIKDDDGLKRNVTIINEAGQKAVALVKQLLAFSRKQPLKMKVVDLNTIIQDLSMILQRIIGEDISLEINLRSDVLDIKADAGQIEQVIMNLVVNARDAMSCGGRIFIETENVELDKDYIVNHKSVTPGKYVMMAVTDTGKGMTREEQEKIFEPFYTTKGGKGTGLGLATVYGIVKQHEGQIFVYSEPGIGTTFKIYLPVTEEERESKGPGEIAGTGKGNETILIVDDEPSVRKLIIDTLQPLGYTVIEASCGNEAIQRVKMMKGAIDLLLTDIIMPDMNGCELVDKVKQLRPDMAFMYTSGYTNEMLSRYGINDSDRSFLPKPITPKKLVAGIRGVLNVRRSK